MKTIVLNYFRKTAMVNNVSEAVEFINSLTGITANETTVKNLENHFAGTNKYPLNEIATTGCGSTRIMVYAALASSLEKHNDIVAEKKAAQREIAETRLNEFREGVYAVDLKVIKLEGNSVIKTIKVNATTVKSAIDAAHQEFWDGATFNAVQTIAININFIS